MDSEDHALQKVVKKMKEVVTTYPNFPKQGITFKDVHPIMSDHETRELILQYLVSRYKDKGLNSVVGLESRGYYFGIPLAFALKIPFIPFRKAGKLPGEVESIEYGLEYKDKEKMEVQKGQIKRGDKVVILDDVLVTGGTAAAAVQMAHQCGAEVLEVSLLIEFTALEGRKKAPQGVNYFALWKV